MALWCRDRLYAVFYTGFILPWEYGAIHPEPFRYGVSAIYRFSGGIFRPSIFKPRQNIQKDICIHFFCFPPAIFLALWLPATARSYRIHSA